MDDTPVIGHSRILQSYTQCPSLCDPVESYLTDVWPVQFLGREIGNPKDVHPLNPLITSSSNHILTLFYLFVLLNRLYSDL